MTVHDPDKAPISPFFKAWGEVVLRYRFVWLALTLGITGLCVQQAATRLQVDTSIEAFLASDSEAFRTLDDLRDDFGHDEMFLVLAEGDVFSLPFLSRLKKLHDELAAVDMELDSLGQRPNAHRLAPKDNSGSASAGGTAAPAADGFAAEADAFAGFGDEGWGDEAGGSIMDEVTSLINARRTTWRNGGLHVGGLLDEWPSAAELPALREYALNEPSLVGRVVAKDGRHTVILLRTAFMNEEDSGKVFEEVRRITARHQGDGFKLQIAGLPALKAELKTLIMRDQSRLAGIGLGLIVLMMAVMFRHPLGVLGPALVVVQAVIWMFGAMAMAGAPMTMITTILPAFILCVGIGDSVHIQSVYRDTRARGADGHEAIIHALATTGTPVFFTTLTTCIGLLSFRLASVDAIQQMGTAGAFGVAIALVHSLVFLPIVLSFNRKSRFGAPALPEQTEAHRDWIDRFLAFSNGLSTTQRKRRITLLVSSAVGVISLAGAATMEVYHNPLVWMPDGTRVRAAFEDVDAYMGGTADLSLLIQTQPGKTLRDRDLMAALDRLEHYIKDFEEARVGQVVANTISVLDVIRESNRAVHGLDQEHYTLPETQRGVTDMLTLFENAGPDELRRLATVDLTRSVLTLRCKWLDATAYAPLTEYILRGVDEYIGDRAVVRPTGAVLNLLTVVGGLLMDLLRSFGTAFAVITLVMIVLLRDIKLGLIAMVPNLLPIAVILGIMGFGGIPIDLNNILIASIAIGIAVDDTIHFLHQFRSHVVEHEDVDSAIQHSLNHAGRAMTTTSVVLVVGFSVLMAADMFNIQRFGLLVATTLVSALLIDLIFTPALLRAFYGPKAGSQPERNPDASTPIAAQ